MTAPALRAASRALAAAARLALEGAWLLLAAWGALALWLDGPASRLAAALLAAGFLASVLLPPLRRPRTLPALVVPILALGVLLGWWLGLPPRNDRDWQPDVARTPTAERHESQVTIRDVRDFDYRSESDFDARWQTRRYDLERVSGLDLFISFWGPTLYAHTILSWQFDDGEPPLAASIETRKERGESYSALRGFFRQYELVYVLADERDVVRLRTSFRGERVLLYRLTTDPAAARALLEQYLGEANALARQPAWYNALTQNCTTGIFHNVRRVAPGTRFDLRLLANGQLDELLYERGVVTREIPLAELRALSDISERAKRCGREDFSRCIREGLPRPAGGGEPARTGQPSDSDARQAEAG